MKTKSMIKTYQSKMKKAQRIMITIQRDMDAIFKVENPTKEQMKEALLLFSSLNIYKKIYSELDSIVGSLLMISKYEHTDML